MANKIKHKARSHRSYKSKKSAATMFYQSCRVEGDPFTFLFGNNKEVK